MGEHHEALLRSPVWEETCRALAASQVALDALTVGNLTSARCVASSRELLDEYRLSLAAATRRLQDCQACTGSRS